MTEQGRGQGCCCARPWVQAPDPREERGSPALASKSTAAAWWPGASLGLWQGQLGSPPFTLPTATGHRSLLQLGSDSSQRPHMASGCPALSVQRTRSTCLEARGARLRVQDSCPSGLGLAWLLWCCSGPSGSAGGTLLGLVCGSEPSPEPCLPARVVPTQPPASELWPWTHGPKARRSGEAWQELTASPPGASPDTQR